MKKNVLKSGIILSLVLMTITGCSSTSKTEDTTTSVESSSKVEESTSEDTSDSNSNNGEEIKTFLYKNKELGFSMEIPAVIEEYSFFEEDSRTNEDETINSVYLMYKGEGDESILVMFEEMSIAYWDKMQAEEGPKPVEVKRNDERVVVMYPLQSNPYEQGTTDFDIINEFTKQSDCIVETFKFL